MFHTIVALKLLFFQINHTTSQITLNSIGLEINQNKSNKLNNCKDSEKKIERAKKKER